MPVSLQELRSAEANEGARWHRIPNRSPSPSLPKMPIADGVGCDLWELRHLYDCSGQPVTALMAGPWLWPYATERSRRRNWLYLRQRLLDWRIPHQTYVRKGGTQGIIVTVNKSDLDVILTHRRSLPKRHLDKEAWAKAWQEVQA